MNNFFKNLSEDEKDLICILSGFVSIIKSFFNLICKNITKEKETLLKSSFLKAIAISFHDEKFTKGEKNARN